MKKNGLTKRIVSLITAVGLTLTSTVMLIPVSAANVGDACSQTTDCTGTYAWVDTEGTHTLQCSVCNVADPDTEAHTYDAEHLVDGCTACEEAAAQKPDTYAVTIGGFEGGEVSANVTEAATGDIVTLTAVPEENYELDELTVTNSDSEETVPVNRGDAAENGRVEATFVMPAANVTVTATFTAVQQGAQKYTVTIDENIENGTVIADKTADISEGDTVTLTVTPASEEYTVDAVKYTYKETPEANTTEVTLEAATENTYTFAMPAANVTVTATFTEAAGEEPEKTFDVWVDNENGTYTYKSNEDGTTTKPAFEVPLTIAEGKTYADVESISIDFAVTGTANGGIGINQGKEYTNDKGEPTHWVQTSYPAAEGNTVTLAVEEGLQSASETLLIQIYWSDGKAFEITASNITINYYHNVTIAEDIEYGTVEADVEKAVEGETVTLTVTPDVGYDLEQLVVTYEDEEGEEKTVEVAKDYTFVMPAADVTVDATFVEHIYPFVITASDESTGSFDKWEDAALFIEDVTVDYRITVNKDVELSTKFTLPKEARTLTFTGEGSLTFTGTKLAVPVDTTFDVKLVAKNKTNLIDITVAKDVELFITENAYTLDEETNEPVQFINKLTGTKTSKFNGFAIVNNIATFGEVNVEEGYLEVNGGKATGIVKLGGIFVIIGDKATAAITEVADDAEIILEINGTVIPKVTIDKFGKAVWVGVHDEDEHRIALPSGTTILYTKNPIPTGEDAIVVKNKTALEDGEELTAYYYPKTKSIKAEVGTALDLYTGTEVSEENKVGNYPNFELLFEEITDPAVDYIIRVNTNLTLDAKFALPKKAASITFIGEGEDAKILTFTGTKLTVPYDVTINNGIVINVENNKKNTMDIAVGKGATLENFGEIIGINKLSGTKTSSIDGEFLVTNLATFDKVSGNVVVFGGKATAINVLDGNFAIYGAKSTAAITTVVPGSRIVLIKDNGVLPKVTLEAIGEKVDEDETIEVTVFKSLADNTPYGLTNGTVILYTKKADFADKITIVNNEGNLKAYTYGKVIKAEYPQAVTVDNLNTTGEAGSENNAELEKDYSNFESAVAAIDAAKDNTAEYVITLNKNIAPEKFALPKYAASVTITSEIGAVINVGKATAITANTDLTIDSVGFTTTTGKLVTINAKKNLTINEIFGDVAAIKGGAKSTLTCVAENSRPDITGFGKVVVCDTLTTGNNFNVNELVLGTSETGAGTLIVSASTIKSSIKALDATNGGRIEYAEGAKALTFTGKKEAFKVAEDGLTISGEVVNGQAVLTTKTVDPEKLANGIVPENEDVEYGFTQMGNNICYMGKVLKVSFIEPVMGIDENEENDAIEPLGYAWVAYATWGEVVEVIEEANNANLVYTITLLDDYNANAAIKFPKAGTYNSIEIRSAQDEEVVGNEEFNFNFTGNLTLTGNTEFYAVNLGAVKNGAPAKYTINAGKNDVNIIFCDTGLLTSITGKNVILSTSLRGVINADKVKATENLALASGTVKAISGITAKNVYICDQYTNLVMNQGSKLAVTGDVIADEGSELTVTILDKKTGEPATLKKNYVVATIKGAYAPDSIVLDEAHEGFALDFVKGKLVVVEAAEEEVSFWTVEGNTYTFKSVYGSKTGEDDTEFDVAGGEDDPYEKGQVDIVALLDEGKTINDIRSITLNFSVNNTANPAAWVAGSAGMCINPDFTWAQTSSYQPDSDAGTYAGSVVLETPEGVSPDNKLLIGVDWANPDSECTFTVELTYAE